MSKDYGHPTTMRFSRTMRQSSTELANAIEHYRRTDMDGITIVIVVGIVMALALIGWWVGGKL